jgi:hypothetical protein
MMADPAHGDPPFLATRQNIKYAEEHADLSTLIDKVRAYRKLVRDCKLP